ncbi:MAG TPA: hypothetical protein VF826_18200 [Chloroflexia bacterium]|jgi:ppGpp synthetase/RelA/SpoT-type nucleotidyltranferase
MIDDESVEVTPAIAGEVVELSAPVGDTDIQFEAYKAWAKEVLLIDFDSTDTARFYNVNSSAAIQTVNGHAFSRDFSKFLERCEAEYMAQHGTALLMRHDADPGFVVKTYKSVVNKSYRLNRVNNSRYPDAPLGGVWVTPENWYELMDDLIRTRIVCTFIDGPKLIAARLQTYADERGLISHQETHQRDRGYYAYHVYVKIPVDLLLPSTSGVVTKAGQLSVEIQLTTQLQDVLYDLTHPIYETLRVNPEANSDEWKWDFSSDRFKLGYMAHTLHMLEALILEHRNKARS